MTKTWTRKRWFVGWNVYKEPRELEIFSSLFLPTQESHGHKWKGLYGPYYLKNEAIRTGVLVYGEKAKEGAER